MKTLKLLIVIIVIISLVSGVYVSLSPRPGLPYPNSAKVIVFELALVPRENTTDVIVVANETIRNKDIYILRDNNAVKLATIEYLEKDGAAVYSFSERLQPDQSVYISVRGLLIEGAEPYIKYDNGTITGAWWSVQVSHVVRVYVLLE
jgi:hypothetical protein